MKFSIVIPIFNIESHLKKCLDSIVNQSYKDYECILVCDKSTDNSALIAKDYAEKYQFKYLYKENTGLSEARNIGVAASCGDYILFLDSDDYFEYDLLEKLNNIIKDQDLIRFQVREVFSDKMIDWNEKFCSGTGLECFKNIINFHYVENAWGYCYNSGFYKKNNFKFMKNCIAEDFGLIPLIISKAKKMEVISYIGYNYVQRSNSLMNNSIYENKIKKMNDMLKQAEFQIKKLKNIDNNELVLNFINNSLIYYSTRLKYKDYKKYNKILKQMNSFDYIINNNFKRKVKKALITFNSYLFYNYLARII